jgi:hypothetical protein
MGAASDALYFALHPNQLGVLVQWWVQNYTSNALPLERLPKLADPGSVNPAGNYNMFPYTSETKRKSQQQPKSASNSWIRQVAASAPLLKSYTLSYSCLYACFT